MPDKTTPHIQAAAKAIYETDEYGGRFAWPDLTPTDRDVCEAYATAALSTTLEPSEAETLAGLAAVEAVPNLFMRDNKARDDGYRNEICTLANGEPEVIAAYQDREQAISRMAELQRRAFVRACLIAAARVRVGE